MLHATCKMLNANCHYIPRDYDTQQIYEKNVEAIVVNGAAMSNMDVCSLSYIHQIQIQKLFQKRHAFHILHLAMRIFYLPLADRPSIGK